MPRGCLSVFAEKGDDFAVGVDAFTNHRTPSALAIIDDDDVETLEQFEPVDPYQLMIEHVSRAVRGEAAWLPDREWSVWVAEAMEMATAR